jgi:hypothetical protein
MHTARGLLGSPRRLTQGCFHPQVIDGYCIPFPRNLSTSSSSSLCSPLQSPFASAPRSTSFDASFTCLGFPPSSRHHSSAATFRAGSHACATFRPPVFSTARRFTPRPSLQVYSIPQPRPGSLPFRGILSTRSHLFLIGRCAPAFGPNQAHRLAPAAARSSPRLRGLYPREAAFTVAPLFTETRAAPLIGFISSRPASPAVDRSYLRCSAHDVGSVHLRFRDRTWRPSPAYLPPKT